jgi:hypothetical protein
MADADKACLPVWGRKSDGVRAFTITNVEPL